jgi:outer membrane receptor protein involved in Fe transport
MTLRLNADVYYNKVHDMQLTLFYWQQYVPTGAPENCYLPANVGTATIKGVELESELRFGGWPSMVRPASPIFTTTRSIRRHRSP